MAVPLPNMAGLDTEQGQLYTLHHTLLEGCRSAGDSSRAALIQQSIDEFGLVALAPVCDYYVITM